VTAVELLPPGEATPDNERWHELRRTGITASEIAAVLGISPWESPFSLYWRKVNDWRTADNEFTSAGRHLEEAIAQWWRLTNSPAHGVMCRAGLYAHPERPWQLATPDRVLCDPQWHDNPFPDSPDYQYDHWQDAAHIGAVECKWVAYSWEGWGEQGTDEIPVYYRAQCLWQLDVLGVDEVHVAALGPGGFRAYVVRRDDDDLEVMRVAGEAFVKRLEAGDPPDLDSHSATLGALKRLHPTVGEGGIEVEPVLALDYTNARIARASAERSMALCEAQIRAALGDTFARATYAGRTLASRSVFTQSRIDTKRLKAELPEIAAEYATTTTVDKLTPGRTKTDD
jgi:putative phage-type endonuclease